MPKDPTPHEQAKEAERRARQKVANRDFDGAAADLEYAIKKYEQAEEWYQAWLLMWFLVGVLADSGRSDADLLAEARRHAEDGERLDTQAAAAARAGRREG